MINEVINKNEEKEDATAQPSSFLSVALQWMFYAVSNKNFKQIYIYIK